MVKIVNVSSKLGGSGKLHLALGTFKVSLKEMYLQMGVQVALLSKILFTELALVGSEL